MYGHRQLKVLVQTYNRKILSCWNKITTLKIWQGWRVDDKVGVGIYFYNTWETRCRKIGQGQEYVFIRHDISEKGIVRSRFCEQNVRFRMYIRI